MNNFVILSLFLTSIIFISGCINQSSVTLDPSGSQETPRETPAEEEVLKPELPKEEVTPTPAQLPKEVIVEITSSGFNPFTVTINSGDKVTFLNKDSSQHWIASNVHPIHVDYPGFDALRGLNQNENYSFTFTKIGTWGYHDHLNPSLTGRIIVR